MPDDQRAAPDHDRLRLSPEDVVLLWGIVDGFRLRATGERWPRVDRILFDLEVMMRKQEPAHAG